MKGTAIHFTVTVGVEDKLVRRVTVFDPNLPAPHNKQVRDVHHLDEWEAVFRDLGLLP